MYDWCYWNCLDKVQKNEKDTIKNVLVGIIPLYRQNWHQSFFFLLRCCDRGFFECMI